jgi:hypothetical protein
VSARIWAHTLVRPYRASNHFRGTGVPARLPGGTGVPPVNDRQDAGPTDGLHEPYRGTVRNGHCLFESRVSIFGCTFFLTNVSLPQSCVRSSRDAGNRYSLLMVMD